MPSLTIANRQTSSLGAMSIFSTRQLFRHSRNCMALPERWQERVPHHYMIGCLYPTHAETALQALRASQRDLVKRVRGLKANTSPLSPEELDKLNHLAATDVQTWVRDELACAREFDLTILGRLLRNRRTLHRRFGQGGG